MFTPFQSILKRTQRELEVTEDFLEMDRLERGLTRKLAGIKFREKHKKPLKPIAPVEEYSHKVDGQRMWKWVGEDNGMKHGELYTSNTVRSYGFKLPKLKKEGV